MSECAFCGHADSRHRILDTIHERLQAGEPDVLDEYGLTQSQLVELEREVYPELIVRTNEGEHCDDCGNQYEDVYWIDDDLWALLHERAPAGLLCPSCAIRRALHRAPHLIPSTII
jgi:hypothetical protein